MESLGSLTRDPGQECLRQEAVSFLEQAIDALPDMYRAVFMCREVEEMSTAETANCLNLAKETVKIRLHRARQMLQNELYARAGATSSQAFQFMGKRCDRVVGLVFERLAGLQNDSKLKRAILESTLRVARRQPSCVGGRAWSFFGRTIAGILVRRDVC